MNLEAKYYCDNFEPIRTALEVIGAKLEGIKEQKDLYFSLPKPATYMKYRIEGEKKTLVYYTRPDFSEGESAPCDFQLYDDTTGALLPILSDAFGVSAIVKKKREQWRKGPAIFHLDDVEGMGRLFEIEYETTDPKGDEKIFQEVLGTFLPYLGEIARKSNGEMVNNK